MTRIGAGACRRGGPSGPESSPVDPAIAPRGLRLMGGGQGKTTKLTIISRCIIEAKYSSSNPHYMSYIQYGIMLGGRINC